MKLCAAGILAALLCSAFGARVNLQQKIAGDSFGKASTDVDSKEELEETKQDVTSGEADEALTDLDSDESLDEEEDLAADEEEEDAEMDSAELHSTGEFQSYTNTTLSLEGGFPLAVGSYNMFWWCTSNQYGNCGGYGQGRGFRMLEDRVKMYGPFDLLGFQECDDVAMILNGAGLGGSMQYATDNHGAPLAWNSQKYSKIGGPAKVWVARDKYGDRYMNWVRLEHKATHKKVFFGNTHGPLSGCRRRKAKLGEHYLDGIASNSEPNDVVVVTGDWNCRAHTLAMRKVATKFTKQATGYSMRGIDHIFTSRGNIQLVSADSPVGAPSDHHFLRAKFYVPN